MKTKFNLLALLLLLCMACHQTESEKMAFDSVKWKTKDNLDYPYRNLMVDDLMANDTLKKLNKVQILEILGEPDRIDSLYLFYMVAQERLKSWPLHTKTLVLKLSDAGTVEKVMIHE